MIGSVLVICTGNICRSPVGHRLLAQACPDLVVGSAGLAAVIGAPADPVTAAVAATQFSVDLADHVAQQFTLELGSSHDLLLVMEAHHRIDIIRQWPQLSGRVMLLGHWTAGKGIEDPYRRSSDVHARVLSDIATAVSAWAKRLPKGVRK